MHSIKSTNHTFTPQIYDGFSNCMFWSKRFKCIHTFLDNDTPHWLTTFDG